MKKNNVELVLNHTPVFLKNLDAFEAGKRFIINQGGSRSSKTYSLCQLLLYLGLNSKLSISVVRKTLPSLKSSVMKDFFDILKDNNIYNEANHNKTENIYQFGNGSEIHFFSVDDEQKIRGRSHSMLFLNEANELSFEVFNQLVMRCKGAVFIDFNPSDTEHWIYDLLTTNPDKSILIKSTYKDNPFLKKDQIDYIENLISVDENFYKIYALGERPISQSRIYTHFKKYIDEPARGLISFGLDFGYNHPTALVRINNLNDKIYCKELIYESKLTTPDLIVKMNEVISDDERGCVIYCDSARPETIEELKRAGFNCVSANKNVKDGIDYLKSKQIFISDDSTNLWKESKLYSWKTNGSTIEDEPVKAYDDGLDALRYGIYSSRSSTNSKFDYEFVFI